MFDLRLRYATHIRHYSITPSEESGWDVRLEEDDTLRRHHRYQDWHRVERALTQFEREVIELTTRGWELATTSSS